MTHVMLDLETLGTMPGCVILSAGACTFDPHADPFEPWVGRSFNFNIDESSCANAGLTVEAGTLAWWERQDPEVRAAVLVDPQPLSTAVDEFHCWWWNVGGRYLWCNGAGFDEPIWRAAAKAVGLNVPWKYWDVRDTRTIWDVGRVDQRKVPREGPAHSAYADARHQARCVQMAYCNMRRGLWPAAGPEEAA